jgi:SAM-dependent methyltransferase
VAILRSAHDIAADLAAARGGLDGVMFDQPVDIERCRRCGSLFRDRSQVPADVAESYRRARYPVAVATPLRDKALADLNADSNRLARFGCGPGARLVEVGSYVGAFLDFARGAGCDIVGVDPNEALAGWCRQRGHDVRTAVFSAELFPRETFDGVWILNCFEQLPDLDAAVQDAHRVLRPGGPLVIRTPNAAFVAAAHHSSRTVLRRIADANAVLGVPYRRCLTPSTIRVLLTRNGFRDVHVRGREFSSVGPSRWVAWSAPRLGAYRAASLVAGRIVHPWLEIVAVRALRPAGTSPMLTSGSKIAS